MKLGLIASANNATRYNENNSTYKFTYKLDDRKNLTEFDIDGHKFLRYEYECQ